MQHLVDALESWLVFFLSPSLLQLFSCEYCIVVEFVKQTCESVRYCIWVSCIPLNYEHYACLETRVEKEMEIVT